MTWHDAAHQLKLDDGEPVHVARRAQRVDAHVAGRERDAATAAAVAGARDILLEPLLELDSLVRPVMQCNVM